MALGIDILHPSDRAFIAETPIFEALVMTEPFAGSEEFLRTDHTAPPVDIQNRRFYWRQIRLGCEDPVPELWNPRSR